MLVFWWLTRSRTILWGGTYVAAPTYSMTDIIEAFTIDTTSKMINQIFQQYQAYVQFTDLGDDASGTKCKMDTHGPEAARYCADGGVYYVKAMTENGNVPNSAMPYGYSGLDGVNIQPWVRRQSCVSRNTRKTNQVGSISGSAQLRPKCIDNIT